MSAPSLRAVAVLLTLVAVAAVARVHARQAEARASAVEPAAPKATSPGLAALARGERMDLNHAEKGDLLALPRIGPALADRILQHRAALGGFRSVDDLDAVPGVGERTLAGLRPYVTVKPVTGRRATPSAR